MRQLPFDNVLVVTLIQLRRVISWYRTVFKDKVAILIGQQTIYSHADHWTVAEKGGKIKHDENARNEWRCTDTIQRFTKVYFTIWIYSAIHVQYKRNIACFLTWGVFKIILEGKFSMWRKLDELRHITSDSQLAVNHLNKFYWIVFFFFLTFWKICRVTNLMLDLSWCNKCRFYT